MSEEMETKPHHANSSGFKAALEVSCFICKALASEIDDVEKKLQDPSITSSTFWESMTSGAIYEIVVYWTACGLREDFHDRQILLVPSQDMKLCVPYDSMVKQVSQPPFPEIGNMNSEAPVTHSPNATLNARRSLDMARSWANACIDRHPYCKAINTWKTGGMQYQPKRLVDIGDSTEKAWKVVLRDDIDIRHHQYATLSHRWDPNQQICLLQSNINEFKTGRPVSRLPQAFQDAITVADKLGIRYIWIDCLCIMQDSVTDWETESLEMCRIYSHAMINLSATGSPNNAFGFLQMLNKPLLLPPRIQETSAPGLKNTWQAVDPFFWWAEVTKTPLMRRGWVFQERFLAPRVLHFGEQQMLWECATLDACEIYPSGLISLDQREGHTGFKKLDAFLPAITRLGSDGSLAKRVAPGAEYASLDDELLHFWCGTVESYTRTRLTKYDDKLVALAGVAEMMSGLYQTLGAESAGYAAGIFTHHLLPMLEWHVRAPTKFSYRGMRPSSYRAPSWSWASIENRVYYDFLPRVFHQWGTAAERRSTALIKMSYDPPWKYVGWSPLVFHLTTQVVPVARSRFGQIAGGSLCCHGRVVPVATILDPKLCTYLYEDPPLGLFQFISAIYVLPLRCVELLDNGHRTWCITGLMIQLVEDRPSTYRRCGLFFISCSTGAQILDIETGMDLSEIKYSDDTILSDIEIV